MLSLSPATRIFIALEPVDLRQSFNGLQARVQSVLEQDPLSGHVFLFTNRHRNRLKLLLFDGSGLWICAKRLEKGSFGWPKGEGRSCCLRPEELSLLLHGLEATPRRHWFRRKSTWLLLPCSLVLFCWTPDLGFVITSSCKRKLW